jgi:hypothetical protein
MELRVRFIENPDSEDASQFLLSRQDCRMVAIIARRALKQVARYGIRRNSRSLPIRLAARHGNEATLLPALIRHLQQITGRKQPWRLATSTIHRAKDESMERLA